MVKNFFQISDLTRDQLLSIILPKENKPLLKEKNIGLIFEKYSTRTRLSFTVGISQLGGNPIEIKFEDLNFNRKESFEDTLKALNCYLDGLIYRTTEHNRLLESSKYFNKPIINALSDISHPCQIISDLYTLYERFKTLKLNILWMGDMNNVCFSLVEAVNIIQDINLTICTPRSISDKVKWQMNKNIVIENNPSNLYLNKVNCVMTDVFISMNDKESIEKIELLKKYSVKADLMSKTLKDSIFMHCLPAKVGLEVSEDVFRSTKSIVWRQAYNRLVAQNNLMQLINWD